MSRNFWCALVALCSLLVSFDADAWIAREDNSDDPNCTQDFRAFPTGTIDVVLHYGACPVADRFNDLNSDGAVDTETCDTLNRFEPQDVQDMMLDIHEAVNAIPGVDIDLQLSTSNQPFTYGDSEGDVTPTIHVGFVVDTTIISGAAAVRTPEPDIGGCHFMEQHMVVTDQSITSWTWDEPTAFGTPWYQAGQFLSPPNSRSLRMVYMHELLHTLGLAHVTETYSMLNNTDRPFFDFGAGRMVQPLPDDIAALRTLYDDGRGLGVDDMLLSNSWVDSDYVIPLDDGAGNNCSQGVPAPQLFNCNPSLGDIYADRFGGTTSDPPVGCRQAADPDGIATCGTDARGNRGSTTVTPCDNVRAEVTIGNPGTVDLDLELRLFFSTDDVFDDVVDVPSSTVATASVDAEDTVNRRRLYDVPDVPDGFYFLLSVVTATPINGRAPMTHWIPMRDGVTVERCKRFRGPLIPGEPPGQGRPFDPGLPDIGPTFDQKHPGHIHVPPTLPPRWPRDGAPLGI